MFFRGQSSLARAESQGLSKFATSFISALGSWRILRWRRPSVALFDRKDVFGMIVEEPDIKEYGASALWRIWSGNAPLQEAFELYCNKQVSYRKTLFQKFVFTSGSFLPLRILSTIEVFRRAGFPSLPGCSCSGLKRIKGSCPLCT